MKLPFIILLCLLGGMSARAAVYITPVPLHEKAALKQVPVAVEVTKYSDGSIKVKLTLAAFQNPKRTFDSFELRVLSKPVNEVNLEKDYHRLELIGRRERSRKHEVEFMIQSAEIAKAYLLVDFWDAEKSGHLTSYCIPATLLLE